MKKEKDEVDLKAATHTDSNALIRIGFGYYCPSCVTIRLSL